MELINVSEKDKENIQIQEMKILKEFDRLCRGNGLKYSVAYGTMIGAVRHKGFIPWDDDVDVWMQRSDIGKLKEICKTQMNENFFYQTNETDSEYFYLLDKIRENNTVFRESFVSKYKIHHGVYIDIFPLDYMPDNLVHRYFHYLHYRFYRAGLMAKYLDINYRTGLKKVMARLVRIAYAPFSVEFLYKKANKTASKYDKKTGYLANLASASAWRDVFPASIYEKVSSVPFEDMEVLCIDEYDRYLTDIYGAYMKLPPVERRNTRHSLTELRLGDN